MKRKEPIIFVVYKTRIIQDGMKPEKKMQTTIIEIAVNNELIFSITKGAIL